MVSASVSLHQGHAVAGSSLPARPESHPDPLRAKLGLVLISAIQSQKYFVAGSPDLDRPGSRLPRLSRDETLQAGICKPGLDLLLLPALSLVGLVRLRCLFLRSRLCSQHL